MGAVFLVCAAAQAADVFVVAAAVYAHHQHVYVVVAEGAGKGGLFDLGKGQGPDGFPVVLDIPSGAEQLGAGGLNPLMDIVRAPVAGGKQDVPSAVAQRQGHALIEHFPVRVAGLVAVVVFQVVHAPGSKGLRILKFMLKAAGVPCAGMGAVAGIHAELQALGVEVIPHCLHAVGKFFRICLEAAVRIPLLQAPAVVDDHVLVARLLQAGFHQRVRCLADQLFIDVPGEGIPGIPAHGRGEAQILILH